MKITAALTPSPGAKFKITDLELDAPREDEICVKIAGVGLCHTDMVFSSGAIPGYPIPAIFGHEGAGIVESIGSNVTKVAIGDRVAITFGSCGQCDRCDDGHVPYCRDWGAYNFTGRRADGSHSIRADANDIGSNFFGQSSFATYALTYERNVVKLPDDVPVELMGPLGCGVQTGVGAILNSLDVKSGSSILITGGGSVGLSAVMGTKIAGCKTIIVLEPFAARRDIAIEFGATHVLDPAKTDKLEEAVRAILPYGVDYAFDTTGIPSVQQAVMGCLGTLGVFGIAGITPSDAPVPGLMSNVMGLGQTIRGIVEGDSNPDEFIPQLVAYYKGGKLPFDKMIKTYPLEQINQAVQDSHDGKCVKAVLQP